MNCSRCNKDCFHHAVMSKALAPGVLCADCARYLRLPRWRRVRFRAAELLQRALGRSDIYAPGDGKPSVLYMRRWRFLRTPWFELRVHHIVRSDGDRELHDHPFDFVSFIISGGYWEERLVDGALNNRTMTRCLPGSFIFRKAETLHRLSLNTLVDDLEDEYDLPAWTFVIAGPRRREWGFVTETGEGWISWKEHVARREGKGSQAGKYAVESSV